MARRIIGISQGFYNGVHEREGEFVNEQGELVKYGSKAQFLVDDPETGESNELDVPVAQLDKLGLDFDVLALGRFTPVTLTVAHNYGEQRSYPRILNVAVVTDTNGQKPAGKQTTSAAS